MITINDILKSGAGGRLPVGLPDTEIHGACVDSTDVVPGSLFVGIRGEVTDGGQYAIDALRDGAAAAVVGEAAWRWIEGEAQALRRPVLVAPDPVAVLQSAGRLALERSGARVVAVTGAFGKTTTKDTLVALLNAAGVRAEGTPGNRNTEIGVPMSLLGLSEGVEVAVVEMGMRGPGQIADLVTLAPPDVACITAIGPVHLELLGSVEAVAAAKAEILGGLREGGVAVVPGDEPLLDEYIAALPAGVRVIRAPAEPAVALDTALAKGWERRNLATALACCEALGVDVAPGTRVQVAMSAMRGQERTLPGGAHLIEDCYNANPLAMRAALEDLATRGGRRVAILGDMRELGADEAAYHREVGEAVREAGVELLIAVGYQAAWYRKGAEPVESVHFASVEEAAAGVPALIEAGDVVLVKGSRGMELERVVAALAGGG
ncbi:MAG: UDP-N-acetylmuramoyl-tripeptide--D-alanyl-D-alanine ligase [Miltoncostaeaceae bacterium]